MAINSAKFKQLNTGADLFLVLGSEPVSYPILGFCAGVAAFVFLLVLFLQLTLTNSGVQEAKARQASKISSIVSGQTHQRHPGSRIYFGSLCIEDMVSSRPDEDEDAQWRAVAETPSRPSFQQYRSE